ncbi:hypothetical protein IR150_03710 [Providencia alcalifaciens]|uniref:hypothetical protein n=1 Tax=Providencia alcalifaciens TaxID=126385 RepID=UPI0015CF8923|nr:hypothetical protein [Providencia alcalifaciens]MBF0690613.1 hypothetical protein [Providencia alcalifaciens]NYS89117.1 hypothetical protein [Providencia alcalifaciens]
MTDYMYQQGLDLIKAMRSYDNFTVKMLVSGCALCNPSARRLLKVMTEIGCVKLIGKYNGKVTLENCYSVDPYAVTKLKAVKLKVERQKAEKLEARKEARRVKRVEVKPVVEKPVELPKKKKTDSLGEMIVVEKACVDGLGNPLLRRFDKLLSGVRA